MSNLILNDNVIGGSSNDSSDILYTPNDNRVETNVQDELDKINTELSDKVDTSQLNFGAVGDCRGDNNTLSSLIQTYCNKLPFGVHFAQVQDNVGTSTIGGGLTSLIILKSDLNYYPIIGFKYISSAGGAMYIGSIFNGSFTGFAARYIT